MITFSSSDDKILLNYTPERQENWIEKAINQRPYVTLKKTFTLWRDLLVVDKKSKQDDLENPSDFDEFETTSFLFAVFNNEYCKVIRGILVNDFDIYIYTTQPLSVDYFVADSNVSVFKVINSIYKEDIYIGGNALNSLPISAFNNLLKYFPSGYERRKYIEARISSVFRNYFDNVRDAEKTYHQYLNKKLSQKGSNLTKTFQESELIKYQTILGKLTLMLNEENQYSENQWQEEILQIILLFYPKYIFTFREVPVYTRIAEGIKNRFLDFLLVDSNGNTDILEIKKPFENAIMTKGVYRDNYIPLRDLSGTVMQIEKYVYYLNRWSYEGEKFLTEKYRKELPHSFDIKITNPGGIIIMGRENNLSREQKRDFEVVKRKYKNVIDIITYDGLIERLKTTITQVKKI